MILDNIRWAMNAARKAKDTNTAQYLGYILSVATDVGKNDGNRNPTDEEVVRVLRKQMAQNNDTIKILEDSTREVPVEFLQQNRLLESFMPSQLDENTLRAHITDIINNEKSFTIGKIMGVLKDKYSGQYDPAMASRIIRDFIK